MKIGFISDLHMDYNYHHDFTLAISNLCVHLKLDYLIFAGDTITNPYYALGFYEGLKNLVHTKIFEIPGNHERYYYYNETNSKKITHFQSNKMFYELLNNDKFGLFPNPIDLKNWVIIGHTGWYDYSFHPKYPDIDVKKLYAKKNFLMNWNDNKYIDGTNKNIYWDIEKTNSSLEKLEDLLKVYQSSNKNICVVTHVVPNKQLIKYYKIPKVDYFNSFLGSEHLSKLYEQYNVKLSIFGHAHHRTCKNINGIEYVNVALGNNYQWKNKLNVYEEIKKTMYVLEC